MEKENQIKWKENKKDEEWIENFERIKKEKEKKVTYQSPTRPRSW